MEDRVLSRRLAETLSVDEIEAVSGSACWATPLTYCWTLDQSEVMVCDGGCDCE